MKCSIPKCKKKFAVMLESHLPVEDLPVLICYDHFNELYVHDPKKQTFTKLSLLK